MNIFDLSLFSILSFYLHSFLLFQYKIVHMNSTHFKSYLYAAIVSQSSLANTYFFSHVNCRFASLGKEHNASGVQTSLPKLDCCIRHASMG